MLRKICWALGIIFLLFGCMGVFALDMRLFGWAILLLGVLFIAGAVLLTIKKKPTPKKSKLIVSFDAVSIYGLPQGETKCKVQVYDDNIAFVAGKQTSKLNIEKVTSAYLKEKKELEGAKTGSIVAGAMFFGAIGAIVSSRVRRNDSYILIINYSDNEEPKAVAVAIEKINQYEGAKAEKYINKQANKHQSQNEIVL